MEVFVDIVSVLMLCALFLCPIIVIRYFHRSTVKYKFLAYVAVAGILTVFILTVLAWWRHFSLELLMTHYGYDFDYDAIPYANVAPEDVERVEQLFNQLMGIGWPLRVIMIYPLYSPYILIVALINHIYERLRPVSTVPSIQAPTS